MRVCLDPGHGGADKANRGPTGYIEAHGVLDIALKARDMLGGHLDVVLTRDKDITLDPKSRVEIVNRSGAVVVVSIHTNAGPISARGTETFHSIYSRKGEGGHKLATFLQHHLVNECNTTNRGVKTRAGNSGDYYYMIRETKPTSVIVECAFHTNPEDEALLKTTAFREKCARGIAKGVLAYFNLEWPNPTQITTDPVLMREIENLKKEVERLKNLEGFQAESIKQKKALEEILRLIESK